MTINGGRSLRLESAAVGSKAERVWGLGLGSRVGLEHTWNYYFTTYMYILTLKHHIVCKRELFEA